MENNRLIYPDACKFIAIFIVTCSHCAQCISGQIWTNFIGGTEIDIAFNMPLFMIISGWFINFDKLRSTNFINYIYSKFKRLILPAISWYLTYCLATIHLPNANEIFTSYWYLKALFICLSIIILFAKLIKNDTACATISSLLIILCPFSDTIHINFMFPFIWAGYFFHKHFKQKINISLIIFCALCSIALSLSWTPKASVYLCPFDIIHANTDTIITFIYRFTIGLSFSVIIIFILKKYETTPFIKYLAKYGHYSLTIYTSSFVINGALTKILNTLELHTNQYILIDCLSVTLSLFIVITTILLSIQFEKNNYLKMIFMGI